MMPSFAIGSPATACSGGDVPKAQVRNEKVHFSWLGWYLRSMFRMLNKQAPIFDTPEHKMALAE